jgi:arylsulfatase A-like enzyme
MKRRSTPPNILLIAVDSLRRDYLSCYGFEKNTTPHIDAFARDATLFEETISAHIPTTSAYASMLTGLDCFGTEVVALRHKGGLTPKVTTLPEMLGDQGYRTLSVGFKGNPASRGFEEYVEFPSWGDWSERPLRKAELLNDIFLPKMEEMEAGDKPWFALLRHMDPHAPYMPPPPFDRLFYGDDPCKPGNRSMDPVKAFKPFRDFHLSWLPPGITDRKYVDAQYEGAIAYMDACIAVILERLRGLGALDNTIVVINGDHGETLYEHECWYDHHGLYDPTLVVPLIVRYPKKLPTGKRVPGLNQHKDLVPTLLDLAGLKTGLRFDGRSLMNLVRGKAASFESEIYLTECTWMRKHGWRTPEWKLIVALEPDFHFKPEIELYNLVEDPLENRNLAKGHPDVVAHLCARMDAHIARREKETGIRNPMHTQGAWHGTMTKERFKTSQEAYDTLRIGDAATAKRLQAESRK